MPYSLTTRETPLLVVERVLYALRCHSCSLYSVLVKGAEKEKGRRSRRDIPVLEAQLNMCSSVSIKCTLF